MYHLLVGALVALGELNDACIYIYIYIYIIIIIIIISSSSSSTSSSIFSIIMTPSRISTFPHVADLKTIRSSPRGDKSGIRFLFLCLSLIAICMCYCFFQFSAFVFSLQISVILTSFQLLSRFF